MIKRLWFSALSLAVLGVSYILSTAAFPLLNARDDGKVVVGVLVLLVLVVCAPALVRWMWLHLIAPRKETKS